jgi:hypothetical protein
MAFGRTFALLLAVLLALSARAQQPETAAGAATPPQAPAGAAVSPGAAAPAQPPAAAGSTPQPAAAGAQRSFWPRKYCRERVMVAAPKAECSGAQAFCTSFLAACKDSKFNRETEKPCYDQASWLQDFSTKNPGCTA